jgi:c(7)-type cytochrome triheme protein
MNRKAFFALALIAVFCGPSLAQIGTRKRRPLPYEYGRVVINNYSEQVGYAPVVFEHWIHRAMFTCRVCHVDIGFAMNVGGTGIRSADNARGYFCGTCHNGKMVVQGKTVFQACPSPFKAIEARRCERCHSLGKKVLSDYDFFAFSKPLPTERFGNGIDWEKAEESGLLKPATVVDGVSPKPNSFPIQKDFALNPKVEGMPDIIFSHEKHSLWNGCELCHPEIFPTARKEQVRFSMLLNIRGRYCGACHGKVAFPLNNCSGCHPRGPDWSS